MHSLKNAILDCFCCSSDSTQYEVLENKSPLDSPYEKKTQQTTQSLANDVLSTMYTANTNDEKLVLRIEDIVRTTGWYDDLARAVLVGLENALKAEAPMGQAMTDLHDKVTNVIGEVWQFTKDHPVFVAVLALGILLVLAPWALEVLGFGELGPIEGSFAAAWQATYRGYVPAKSLFSYFQRLRAMVGKL